jgi:hypothetical protein
MRAFFICKLSDDAGRPRNARRTDFIRNCPLKAPQTQRLRAAEGTKNGRRKIIAAAVSLFSLQKNQSKKFSAI